MLVFCIEADATLIARTLMRVSRWSKLLCILYGSHEHVIAYLKTTIRILQVVKDGQRTVIPRGRFKLVGYSVASDKNVSRRNIAFQILAAALIEGNTLSRTRLRCTRCSTYARRDAEPW
jgi:hypothetical protein